MSAESIEQDIAQLLTPEERAVQRRPDGMPVGKPWQKGQSGNPWGRRMEAALQERLQKAAEHAPPGMTALEAVMNSLAVVAQRPDHPAWSKAVQMVLDRTDGAVAKTLKIEGELPLKVVVRGDRE